MEIWTGPLCTASGDVATVTGGSTSKDRLWHELRLEWSGVLINYDNSDPSRRGRWTRVGLPPDGEAGEDEAGAASPRLIGTTRASRRESVVTTARR